MNMILWAGLVANALVHLRSAVLRVQDGEDRVKAGEFKAEEVICWQEGGVGIPFVILCTMVAPILTAYKVGKFLLFPRGIKSQFAKEQEARDLEKRMREWEEAALKADEEERAQLLARTKEYEALILAWAPGDILLAAPQPEQLALSWDDAADAFDVHAAHVAATAGQPWSPVPVKLRVKAKVGEQ